MLTLHQSGVVHLLNLASIGSHEAASRRSCLPEAGFRLPPSELTGNRRRGKPRMKSLLRALATFALTTSAFAQAPGVINYQGRVVVNGTNFTGTGQFKFALVDGGDVLARQATATAHRTGTFVTSIIVTDGGLGYVLTPPVTISGGGGAGATAHAVLSDGSVTNIVVDQAGTGYTSDPLVTVDPPPPIYRTFWSNGTSAVSVPVNKGLYSVLLGDTSLPNMETAVPALVFTNSDVRLRVWFNDGMTGFQQLSPDPRIGAAGYALVTATVPGTGFIGAIKVGGVSDPAPSGRHGPVDRHRLPGVRRQPLAFACRSCPGRHGPRSGWNIHDGLDGSGHERASGDPERFLSGPA